MLDDQSSIIVFLQQVMAVYISIHVYIYIYIHAYALPPVIKRDWEITNK